MALSPLILAVLAGGCRSPEPASPDIVLVLVDGLRADLPGERFAEAAFLGALGQVPSLRFDATYAQSPAARLSFGSLLTGRYVSAIPLCAPPSLDLGRSPLTPAPPGETAPAGEDPWCVRIPAEKTLLPEVLGLYGYETALWTLGEPTLGTAWRGFEHVGELPLLASAHPWADLVAQAGPWWASNAGDPRFLVVAAQVLTPWTLEAFGRAMRPPSEEEKISYFVEHPEVLGRISGQSAWPIPLGDAVDQVRTAYQDAARVAGEEAATLFDALGGDRPRVVIVSSLHGLALGEPTGTRTIEQASPGTHQVLVDRVLRVPILVFEPGRSPDVRGEVRQLVDLAPTLYTLARAVPPAVLDGRDLRDPASSGQAWSEFGDMLSLRKGNLFLGFRSQSHGVSSIDPQMTERLGGSLPGDITGRPGPARPPQLLLPPPPGPAPRGREPPGHDPWENFELYDLAVDPTQAAPLDLERRYETFHEMADWMWKMRAGAAAPPREGVDWATVQELRRKGMLHYW